MPAQDGHQADDGFYFDLASPECYLVAEQILQVLPGPLEWRPVIGSRLAAPDCDRAAAGATDEGVEALRASIGRRADELGLQPLRWPPGAARDSELAMRAATYAKSIGRTVAFAQAAFRQAFAGGHDLARTEPILIAAAACEIHPRALLRALESRVVQEELASANAAASRAGVRGVPTVIRGGLSFTGTELLEDARNALTDPRLEVCPS